MKKVNVDAGRVSLASEMVKPFGDTASRDDIQVWLFLIDPGHLRVMANQTISELTGFDLNKADALALATREERERLSALRMRIFETSINPSKKRLAIPAEVFEICDETEDRTHIWIDFFGGILELYTVTYGQRRLATSPERLLRKPERETE